MILARELKIRAGEFLLENIEFHIEPGQYAILMGKTGSGKTTLLEAICGLKSIESGSSSPCSPGDWICAPGWCLI